MKMSQAIPLICLSITGLAHAQAVTSTSSAAAVSGGASVTLSGTALPDPALNWRDPMWLARQRDESRWRYQLGLEHHVRSPVQLGPQASVREAVWAGVSYGLTQKLRGGVEAPVWERDTGWASHMAFEKPKKEGIAGLRGAFSYELSPRSQVAVRPSGRRLMLSYSSKW